MPVDLRAHARNDEGCLAKINWTLRNFNLADLTDYYKNPRSLSEKEFKQLKTSLDKFGMIDKPIVNLDADNTIIGGHQRKHVLEASGVKECECWVPDRELTEREVEELNIRLNKNTGSWDFDTLANEFELDDLLEWGFDKGELDIDLWQPEGETPEDLPVPDEELVMRVPDAVWGSDNLYGIPMLDINMQADHLEAPFAGWGTMARKNRMTGTYHFYVSDDRFEQVWRDPVDIANSACYAIVEPNFSVYTDMPKAVALWQMFRKRWITRWLQSIGIRAFVDLNIAHKHDDLRFIGVPEGWKAYCTRAYSERLDETIIEYEQAVKHAGGGTILFVCYGGGKKAEELSMEHGWIWYPDQQTQYAGGKQDG